MTFWINIQKKVCQIFLAFFSEIILRWTFSPILDERKSLKIFVQSMFQESIDLQSSVIVLKFGSANICPPTICAQYYQFLCQQLRFGLLHISFLRNKTKIYFLLRGNKQNFIQYLTSFGWPVLKAYTRFNISSACSCRWMVRRNFGLSGRTVNTIPMKRLINELQIKYNRHDLKSMNKICHWNSIGMMIMATSDVKTTSPFKQIIQNATARGADLFVWNSLTYEYAPACEPANLQTVR